MINAARIAVACLTMIGCSSQTTSGDPELVGTLVTETMVAEVNESVTPAMLVGRWGDNGDCTKDIAINADGTFTSHTGAGTSTLDGNTLTMARNAETSQVWVGTIGDDQLVFGQPNGSATVSRRCP